MGWHDIFYDLEEFLLETQPAKYAALMSAFIRRAEGLR